MTGKIPDAVGPDPRVLTSHVDDHLSMSSREALRASKTSLRRK